MSIESIRTRLSQLGSASPSTKPSDSRGIPRASKSSFLSWSLTSALLASLGVGCSDGSAPEDRAAAGAARSSPELTVYAASSTRDGLAAINARFEAGGRARIVVNFGSSGDLARQILAAGQADVFLSADTNEMDRVEEARLLLADSRRDLLSNQLVVIEPASAERSLAHDFEPSVLASARVARISLAHFESVPAGRYARAWLEACGIWERVSEKVIPGVDVRAALAAVESGAAEAGIVYRTDIARSTRVRSIFVVPLEDCPRIVYPVGALAERDHADLARAYIEFLGCDEAREIWRREGFLLPTPARK